MTYFLLTDTYTTPETEMGVFAGDTPDEALDAYLDATPDTYSDGVAAYEVASPDRVNGAYVFVSDRPSGAR